MEKEKLYHIALDDYEHGVVTVSYTHLDVYKRQVFATGTPISNSMVELYTIQRYLQYNTLVKKMCIRDRTKGVWTMNELTYTMVGDYSLPNLKLPQQPEVTLGRYCLLYTSTALMTTTSAKDGSFSFAKVPYGKWIVREIEQPKGFEMCIRDRPLCV